MEVEPCEQKMEPEKVEVPDEVREASKAKVDNVSKKMENLELVPQPEAPAIETSTVEETKKIEEKEPIVSDSQPGELEISK